MPTSEIINDGGQQLLIWIFSVQGNVLAAEKPPDTPSHSEESGEVFLKKDDFLFDAFDQLKDPQDLAVSENDVFMFDESAASPSAAEEETLHLQPAAERSEWDSKGFRC